MTVEMKQEFIEGMPYTLSNMEIRHAHLKRTDTPVFEGKPGKEKWYVDALVEPAMAQSMLDSGMKVKPFSEDDPQQYIRATRLVKTTKGKAMKPPKITDMETGEPIDGDTIGDGSIVNLKVYSKYCKVMGQMYCPVRLNEVEVVKLVEYSRSDGESEGNPFEES